MAPEPEANADLTTFLSRKDRDKFIEDWLVEDHGIPRWKAKGMVKLVIAPLTNLAGEVAGRWLQKIHQALRKHSDGYDKASRHFSNLLLIKIECERTKTKYSDQYLIPPEGEDRENWNKLNEQTQVWIKQLEKLDLISLSLGDLKATIRLNLDQPNLKKDSAPSRWLRPYNAFIPLTGRDREMDQLNDWRDGGKVFSWKIIIGEGGIGKTRLAQEFARSCIESGWDSGFLYHDILDRLVHHDNFSNWSPLADTLIIVDYAATKQESLKKLLHRCAESTRNEDGQEQPAKLRLLLLERHEDDEQGWVKTLLSVGQGALNDEIFDAFHKEVLELKPPQQQSRNETMVDILQATLNRWEKLTGGTAPKLPAFTEADFEQLQTHTEGRPLYLQMAALHTCEIGSAKELARWNRATLLEDAVKREREYIDQHCASSSSPNKLVERVSALLYFAGKIPANHPGLLKIIEQEATACGYPQIQPAELRATLCQLLQEDNAKEGASLNPIQPDLIGAAFSATVLQEQNNPTETLNRAILLGRETAWANLLRSAQDLYAVGTFEMEAWLTPLLAGRSRRELWKIANNLLPNQTVALRFFAVHLYEALLSQSDNAVEQANIFGNLGNWYSALGKPEEAFAAALRAMKLFERLAQRNPDAFEPDLAMSLNNLGNCYSELGRREEALETALKVMKLYERLAQKNPDAFEPDLASSLNNLGNRYSALGRREQALESALKAMKLYERLAQKNPDAFEPDLAMSLGALGSIHLKDNHADQAIEIFARGIQTLTRLFQMTPQAFAELIGKLMKVYLQSCEAAGKQPDMGLLAPITKKLEEMEKK